MSMSDIFEFIMEGVGFLIFIGVAWFLLIAFDDSDLVALNQTLHATFGW